MKQLSGQALTPPHAAPTFSLALPSRLRGADRRSIHTTQARAKFGTVFVSSHAIAKVYDCHRLNRIPRETRRSVGQLGTAMVQSRIERLQERDMAGEPPVDILGESFVVGVRSPIAVFEHGEPAGFIGDPVVGIGQLEAAFGGLAVEAFRSGLFLNHLPGEFKAKLETLNGGIAAQIGFRSLQRIVQARDGLVETLVPCGHSRIP